MVLFYLFLHDKNYSLSAASRINPFWPVEAASQDVMCYTSRLIPPPVNENLHKIGRADAVLRDTAVNSKNLYSGLHSLP